ncbi:MAG: hypothetical protein LBI43_07530 [Streptococcaceae bacterium]|jgi:hypothetical protein|nr:hypothetical protein [Streptococcaceae bacterium]
MLILENEKNLIELKKKWAKETARIRKSFAGGDGTITRPYEIETPEQLALMGEFPKAYYILTCDINLQGLEWTPITYFSGHFDGNHHAIRHLRIQQGETEVGLFANLTKTAVVKDLRVVGAEIQGKRNVGIIAGRNHGLIIGCSVSGFVEGYSNINPIVGLRVAGHVTGTVACDVVVGTPIPAAVA